MRHKKCTCNKPVLSYRQPPGFGGVSFCICGGVMGIDHDDWVKYNKYTIEGDLPVEQSQSFIKPVVK